MQIRMTRTQKGSPDGIRTLAYSAGQEYSVPDSLALAFIADGAATAVTVEQAKPADAYPATNEKGELLTEKAPFTGPSETAEADGPSETKPARSRSRGRSAE